MKNIIVIACIFCFATIANSGMVESNVTENQIDLVLENPANKVVSTLGFCSGSSNNLYAVSNSRTNKSDLALVSGGRQDIIVYYDSPGILTMDILSTDGYVRRAYAEPDDWFNAVYITLVQKKPAPTIKETKLGGNLVNGLPVQNLITLGGDGEYYGVELLFDDMTATNQPTLLTSGTFEFDAEELVVGDFVCEIIFVQRNDLIDQKISSPRLLSSILSGDSCEVFWNADTTQEWIVQCQNGLQSDWEYYCATTVVSNGLVSHCVKLSNDTEYFRLASQSQ